ncbi:hypothetical protein ACHWGL_19730, partial [Klebsiella pneumoniae]
APENPQQDATADGYGNTTAAVKPASDGQAMRITV